MIIDVRNRPPTDEFGKMFPRSTVEWVCGRLGFEVAESWKTRSVDTWLQEIQEGPVDKVVVVSRTQPGSIVENEHIADLQQRYSDVVIGCAGIHVSGIPRPLHDPVKELQRCVQELDIFAVAVDPGMPGTRQGLYPDDARLSYFYKACEDLKVPIVMMTGPFAGRDFSYGAPETLDRICSEFPRLKLVAGHGCYPYASEAVGAAFKHPNLFLSPDCYIGAPGSLPYREAAGGMLVDQMLFGSACPFGNIRESYAAAISLGLEPEAWEKFMGKNAERVFARAIEGN